jgi:DNA-binding winged helix-turn-helix (wHTH) protein
VETVSSVAGPDARAIGFGAFVFDPVNRVLCRDGVELPLPPRALGVLVLLLERSGNVITKQELLSAVWPDAFVSETSLAEAISVLRQTLGDDPQRPRYIQTLHRRGYRFVAGLHAVHPAPVRVEAAAEVPDAVAAQARVSPPADPEREPRLSLLVPWLVTLFALLTAAVAVWRHSDVSPPQRVAPVRFTVTLPAGVQVAASDGPLAVSNNGSMIAVSGCDGTQCAIYVRSLSQTEFTRVAGTAGGQAPFFSADGRAVGFFADGRLLTIGLGGGAPKTVAMAPGALGAAWLADGRIVFARSAAEGLFVATSPGAPLRRLTRPTSGEGGHRWPAAVPDGAAVAFTVAKGAAAGQPSYGAVASLDTGTWARVIDEAAAVRLPAPEYLVAQRGETLVASWFDVPGREVMGLPVTVPAPALMAGAPQFAVNDTGTLVAVAADRTTIHVVLHWAADLARLVPAPQPRLPR